MSKEIKVKKEIITKTDFTGKLIYANDEFEKISKFKSEEYLGQNQNIVRHPDMPKIIFKKMWEEIEDKSDFDCILKNKTKDGNYYWVSISFQTESNATGQPIGYVAKTNGITSGAKKQAEKLYFDLLEMENDDGIEASKIYLETFLRVKKITFGEFMLSLINTKSGFFSMFK